MNKLSGKFSLLMAVLFIFGALFAEDYDSDAVPERGGTGTINVITTPEKATVFLGGEELGITPIEGKSFASGRYDLTIMLGGEELIRERINVWPGKVTNIEKELIMPYGIIIVNTEPGYASIQIDGVDVGRTEGGALTINNVEAGDHVVSATAKGRAKQKMDITIQGQDTVLVDLKLKKR